MREKIFNMVFVQQNEGRLSRAYDTVMICAIVLSLLPLCFKEYFPFFQVSDKVLTVVFIADYLMRWSTADFLLKRGARSFLIYPFTPMAIIDLLSLLPFLLPLNNGFRALRLLRLLMALRMVRFIRESRSFRIIRNVLTKEKGLLLMVAAMAVVYILGCALVMFNIEPDTFDNFFDAIYWSCISLLTVGYGDFYPHTDLGRLAAMVSSMVGVALIALPSGIISGGFIDEIRRESPERN